MEEVQVGLDSLERLTQAANDLKAESETVGSVLDKSRRELNKMEGRIAKDKRFYYESLDRCKAEESEIEAQLEPLEKLRAEAQAEFDKVGHVMDVAESQLNIGCAAVIPLATCRIAMPHAADLS